MKFCYLDESGNGAEKIFVLAGIVVDAQRMQVTKADWAALIKSLSDMLNRRVDELHTHNFYKGNGIWRGLNAEQRIRAMEEIINWLAARRHQVIFAAIDKAAANLNRGRIPTGFRTQSDQPDCAKLARLHILLSLQKTFQSLKVPKGNTVLVFDKGSDEGETAKLVLEPPEWSDSFYGYSRSRMNKKSPIQPLNVIVDVPYHADSRHLGLLQLADFFAYILRRFAEFESGYANEEYSGERNRFKEWVARIAGEMTPDSHRWISATRSEAVSLYREIAPPSLLSLAKVRKRKTT